MKKTMADDCHWCGKQIIRGSGFKNYQLGSRFCDDECRTHYHNAIKKIKTQKSRMFEFIAFIQEQMTKGGELSLEAGIANDMIFELSRKKSGVKIHCRQCGQRVMWKPRLGEKCQFCGDSDWQIGENLPSEE